MVDELADEGEPRREERVGVLVEGVVVVLGDGCRAMTGCSSMTRPRSLSSTSEAACGGWFLNMNPKRPSVVGLWVARSMPRSSAPWGGMGAGSAAAAGAIQGPLTAVPSEAVAAVPSETAAVPFRKRRRLKPRARFSDIFLPRFVGRSTLSLLAQSQTLPRLARACQGCLSKHGAVRSPRPPSHLRSGRFTAKRGPGSN